MRTRSIVGIIVAGLLTVTVIGVTAPHDTVGTDEPTISEVASDHAADGAGVAAAAVVVAPAATTSVRLSPAARPDRYRSTRVGGRSPPLV